MSDTQFYSLAENACKKLDLPAALFPVRTGKEKDIFHPNGVASDLLLDELEAYLAEHPQERPLYKDLAVKLAYFEGVKLGQEGFHDMAAHAFELGLAMDPEELSLRVNYALALQSSGRSGEALTQYRYLLQRLELEAPNPLVWILAARQFLDAGDPVTASQLLEATAQFMPAESEFWELLAEARERAGTRPWVPAAEKRFCGACRNPVKAAAKFCGACGKPL